MTSIGTPIANTQVYVLGDDMAPCPIGVAGTLYIGGAGVTRGYFERPDLTAERFVEDPFIKGGRIYNTGDLARWQVDGTLDFLGRADFQVKLRGYRIEMGEIESVIDQFEGVQQSVVMAREDTPGVVQLVGYLLTETEVDIAALKAQMGQSLPDYMIPQHFVRLDAFPLTPNKKTDRKALPPPTPAAPAPAIKAPEPTAEAPKAEPKQAETAAPTPSAGMSEGEASAAVAAIWTRTLGVQDIGPSSNFFDLGGHSLLAVQVHREIRQSLGVAKLSITDIFRAPTLSALAAIVAKKSAAGGPKPASQPKAPAPAPAPATAPVPAPPQTAPAAAAPAAAPEQPPAAQEEAHPRHAAMAARRAMRERRRSGA